MKPKTKIIALLIALIVTLAEGMVTAHSPILSVRDITLTGDGYICQQFKNERGYPLAFRKCTVYVEHGGKIGEIRTETDADGWIFIANIPDNDGVYIDFVADITIEDDEEKNGMEQLENPPVELGEKQCAEITKMLEEFFPLYIAGDERWKDFVPEMEIGRLYDTKEFLISDLEEAREEVYSLVEDFSFTVYPETLAYCGADLYSLTLGFSCYVPKIDEHFTEDDTQDDMTVAYYQGKWWVVELPQ